MKKVHIILFGIGNVGSTLIQQINKIKSSLEQNNSIALNLIGIANSKRILLREQWSANWEQDFKTRSKPYTIKDVIDHVKDKKYTNLVAVDATASHDIIWHYNALIRNGFNIVTANKYANTARYDYYKKLRQDLLNYNKKFLYETNVGAALPVVETIRNLKKSGEEIYQIRGVFSGSLSYIFNTFSVAKKPFSEVLTNAMDLGFTEPDAREDLSGNDVARKLLILARELGFQNELSDIKIESLVPKQLNGHTSLSEFKSRIQEINVPFQNLKALMDKDTVLRYVGNIDMVDGSMAVKLISVPKHSALGQLKGSDSMIEVFSESYPENPLVIQGAGAGKTTTARGVLTDIIKVTEQF